MIKRLLLLLLSTSLYSQQERLELDNLYRFNFLVNPALSPYNFKESFIGLGYRTQWTNVYQAPKYTFISYSDRTKERNNAYNTYILNKNIGVFEYAGLGLSYSYKIPFNKDISMSLGVSMLIYRSYINFNKINDPKGSLNLTGQKETYLFNTDFGGAFQFRNLVVGLSANNIYNNKISSTGTYNSEITYNGYITHTLGIGVEYRDKPNYGGQRSAFGSFFNNMSGGVSFTPIIKLIYSKTNKFNYETFLLSEIMKTIKLQVGYGNRKGLNTMLGINLSDNLEVYYSYDFGGNIVSGIKDNSNEITLVYNIGLSTQKQVPVRQMKEGLKKSDVVKIIDDKIKNIDNNKSVSSNNEKINELNKKLTELEKKTKNIDNKTPITNDNKTNELNKRLLELERKTNEMSSKSVITTNELNRKLLELERKTKEIYNSKIVESYNRETEIIKKKIAELEKNSTAVNRKETEELKKKLSELERKTAEINNKKLIEVDNRETDELKKKLASLEKTTEEIKNIGIVSDDDTEALNKKISELDSRIYKLENQKKKTEDIKVINEVNTPREIKETPKKEETKNKKFVVIGVYYTEPKKDKQTLISKGYINTDYFIQDKLYYLYLDVFNNIEEAYNFIKEIKYKDGNIWVTEKK